MSELLTAFKPDNVFTLVFFIVVVGSGIFLARNWKDILVLFQEREKNRHAEVIAKRDSGELTREALAALTASITEHNKEATVQVQRQTFELQKVGLKLEVLTQVMERIAEKTGNGYDHKSSSSS